MLLSNFKAKRPCLCYMHKPLIADTQAIFTYWYQLMVLLWSKPQGNCFLLQSASRTPEGKIELNNVSAPTSRLMMSFITCWTILRGHPLIMAWGGSVPKNWCYLWILRIVQQVMKDSINHKVGVDALFHYILPLNPSFFQEQLSTIINQYMR